MDRQQQPTIIQINTRPRPQRRWIWVIVAVVILLILLVINAPTLQNGSTYSRSSKGYRNWFDYMVEQEHPIQRWQQPYSQLQGTDQTLIRIAENFDNDQNQRVQSPWLNFSSWLEQGNTMIILTWDGQVSAAPFSSDLNSSVGPVLIETTRRHSVPTAQKTNLKDDYGAVVWSQTVGKGHIILATYPWIGANIYADQPGNYRFLEKLISSTGPIWVDERLHGYREEKTQAGTGNAGSENLEEDRRQPEDLWQYLAQTPIAAVAAQLVLLAILGIWGHNHRFGLPVRLSTAAKDNSQQYIQALAGTLNDAYQREWVLTQLRQYVRQTLVNRLGLGGGSKTPGLTDAILAAQWAVATGRNDQELLELLQQGGQPPPRNDRDLLVWVQKADGILQDIP
ncbi:MAG: DUF4350 domain-containing protein [Acaryochloris sp. RU_4_1]|nr:DUF4350 domain-containing protein [Acaryochloris sp. RU_4_1]NJR53562.1 DUF4350 domain-containing protein [Acaryochloris sp. CRU_2_0]